MLEDLFDPQLVIFAGLTVLVILITLIVLAIISRRVRFLMSEVQGLRRELSLVDEALRSVNISLQANASANANTEEKPDTATDTETGD
ncbi:MAG: hypothetical protein KAI47_19655 [Deltaproteobacteria bacterium]|nr:hypothetical protein [Deltaproteobacteria bacterium]